MRSLSKVNDLLKRSPWIAGYEEVAAKTKNKDTLVNTVKIDGFCCKTQLRPVGLMIRAMIGFFVLASATHAFTVPSTTEYGVMRGTNVSFINISDPSTLYGVPTIDGNNLVFNDPSFASLAGPGGVLSDVTDGRLGFTLQADPSTSITVLTLDEFGAISLTAPAGTANSGTLVRVQAPAFATVNEVLLSDGTVYTLPTAQRFVSELEVTPSESSNNAGFHAADPNVGSYWQGSVSFDIPALLAGVSGPDGQTIVGATNIDYDMNNTLIAIAQDGISTAFIDKKGIEILPQLSTIGVPEPASGLMLATPLLGLTAVCRASRRRNKIER